MNRHKNAQELANAAFINSPFFFDNRSKKKTSSFNKKEKFFKIILQLITASLKKSEKNCFLIFLFCVPYLN